MPLFKKKKNPKALVDCICGKLESLPSAERVEEVVKVAIEKAEALAKQRSLSIDDSFVAQKTVQSARLSTYKTAVPVASVSANQTVLSQNGSQECLSGETDNILLKPDCVIGVNDGMTQEEISALDAVEKKLSDFSSLLSSSTEKEEDIVNSIKHALECHFVLKLLKVHAAVTFNTRQAVANIIVALLSKPVLQFIELKPMVEEYMNLHVDEILTLILDNYGKESIALHTGLVFRECLNFEVFYRKCLTKDFKVLNKFFDELLAVQSFESVSDAYSTFRAILLVRKQLVKEFLEENYDTFFKKYNNLLKSSEYISRRHSLKLLSDILLCSHNSSIMLKYISEKTNLVLIMTLMRVKSPSMRLEAFHVFKIFVANPNKTEGVTQILQKNREKLIAYLSLLTTEQKEELFQDEKKLVIRSLENLPPLQENH